MPKITIDGQVLEVAPGKMIIEAAYENNIEVPHFCWHPGLSVAGNCRMCLVNVGSPKRGADGSIETDSDGKPVISFIPKLQIACATPISDGMVVDTLSERVKNAQKAIMEFLLINHPLDCPICDEAGQCKLQEYAYKHSKGESRFIDKKNHKEKRKPLGPNVLFDGERCISCSRCIRFAKEVAEQPHLTFVQRGDHVTIDTFEGKQFNSDYSMNVIDICPVGALTSPDFRFKARVWDMSFSDSICVGCSKGCNVKVGVRNNEILRLEAKTNMAVNEFWMCDEGRLNSYQHVNTERVFEPIVQGKQVSWDDAISFATEKLKQFKGDEIFVLTSAKATNEDNYIVRRFASEVLGTQNVDFIAHTSDSFADSFLKKSDLTPNRNGVQALNFTGKGIQISQLLSAITSGKVKAMYVMEDCVSHLGKEFLDALSKLQLIVVHSPNHNPTTAKAHVVFPATTFAEHEGTYTNSDGRVQHVKPAIATKENSRLSGLNMSRLDKFGAPNDRWSQGERRNARQSWKVIQLISKGLGHSFGYSSSEKVFTSITEEISQFAGMSYDALDERRGIVLGKSQESEEYRYEYESHTLKPN